jgi:hypothetical protein
MPRETSARHQSGSVGNNLTFVQYDLGAVDADHGSELVIEEPVPAVFDVFWQIGSGRRSRSRASPARTRLTSAPGQVACFSPSSLLQVKLYGPIMGVSRLMADPSCSNIAGGTHQFGPRKWQRTNLSGQSLGGIQHSPRGFKNDPCAHVRINVRMLRQRK